jgi:nucleotide-binding universal stress UspA family protein
MLAIQTILHPTDFSERSGYAFETALALARDYGAQLVLVHVTTPPQKTGPEVEQNEEYQQALQEKLRWLHPAEAPVRMEARLLEGDAAAEIIRIAEEYPCDLIVMGTHGRTDRRGQAMGSVAGTVIRKAPCPVVIVRNQFAKATTEAGMHLEEPVTARSG